MCVKLTAICIRGINDMDSCLDVRTFFNEKQPQHFLYVYIYEFESNVENWCSPCSQM